MQLQSTLICSKDNSIKRTAAEKKYRGITKKALLVFHFELLQTFALQNDNFFVIILYFTIRQFLQCFTT